MEPPKKGGKSMKEISMEDLMAEFTKFIKQYPAKPILVKTKYAADVTHKLHELVDDYNAQLPKDEKMCGFGLYFTDPYEGHDRMILDDKIVTRRENPSAFEPFIMHGTRLGSVMDEANKPFVFCYQAGQSFPASERAIQYAGWMADNRGTGSFIWITKDEQTIPTEIEEKFTSYQVVE